jgi:hypothetical protein
MLKTVQEENEILLQKVSPEKAQEFTQSGSVADLAMEMAKTQLEDDRLPSSRESDPNTPRRRRSRVRIYQDHLDASPSSSGIWDTDSTDILTQPIGSGNSRTVRQRHNIVINSANDHPEVQPLRRRKRSDDDRRPQGPRT